MEDNLTLGEKLLTAKNRLYRDICNFFQASGIDVALGVLILDGVKADIMDLGYEAALERLAAPAPERNERKEENPDDQSR